MPPRFALLAASLALTSCGAPTTTALNAVQVDAIRIDSTNVGLISRRGETLMVDIGLEGAYAQLLLRLENGEIDPGTIHQAVITHGHGDHAGDIPALLADGIEVLLHEDDLEAVQAGENATGEVIGLEATILEAFVSAPFPPSLPTTFRETFVIPDLDVIVEHVGGHTAGSVVVTVGGEVSFVGDLVRGGNLGGLIAPELPLVHYFHEDQTTSHQAMRDLLNRYPNLQTVWPAHGGPFTRDAVETWLDGIGF